MDVSSNRTGIVWRVVSLLALVLATVGVAASTVSAAPATQLEVAAPANVTAGAAFSVTVTARDASNAIDTGYTGTIHFTTTDAAPGVQLPANHTFVAGDNGVHTFTGVVLRTVGARTITATDTVTSSITGSDSINVTTPVTHLVVSAPAAVVPGVAFNVTVTAKDASNVTVTGYRGTVHFTSTDGTAVLPADHTFAAGDNGVHVFSVILNTIGNQTITATDTVNTSITGTSAAIGVGLTHLVVSAPSAVVPGVAFNVTVTAKDANNVTVTGYLGTVHITSTDGTAVLPADHTFTAGDNGVHVFSVILNTIGNQTITATDTVNTSITGTSAAIAVGIARLVVTAPSSVAPGVAFNVTVTAKDANNVTVTGYRGTVHFTSTDGTAVLPANHTFTAGDSGVHVFSVTLNTIGNQTVTATDTVNTAINGTSAAISVGVARFVVSAPATVTAGVAFDVTVTAKDVNGATATGYLGTVHFSSTDPSAVGPGNYTFVASDLGTHTFRVTFFNVGTRTITATDTVRPTVTGTSGAINVVAAVTPPPTRAPGYWMLGRDGNVYAFGAATNYGNAAAAVALLRGFGVVAVDIAGTPSTHGYWIVDSAGLVYPFGDAQSFGDMRSRAARQRGELVMTMAATPTGNGYWLVTSLGRVFAFGDAALYGDLATIALNGPIVDAASTPSGHGYYLVASDGGVFTFGDAAFHGSMGGQRLNAPVRSIALDADGSGYWLVASDGGVFSFAARFAGSLGGQRLNQPVVAAATYGNAYLLAAADGGIFNFGDRDFLGSLGSNPPAVPVTSLAAFSG